MFVNLTLSSLSTSSTQRSALVSMSPRSQKSNVKFENVLFSRSFAPFFSGHSVHASVKILHSSFSKLTQNAIHLSEVTWNYTRFDNSKRSKPDDDLVIKFCHFTEISSKKNGGAIYLKNYRYSLTLMSCGFSLCSTHNIGGACYVLGYEFASCKCCFYGCVALVSEQAVFSDIKKFARDEAVDNSFNYSFISQCSPRQSRGPRRAISCSGGVQFLVNSNFTSNYVTEEAAGAIMSYPTVFTMKFCDFSKSSGNSILWMHLLEESFVLSFCNIFNNSLPGNMSSIIVVEQSRAVITKITFFYNRAYHYLEGTYSAILQECMFDVKRYAGMFGALTVADQGTKYSQSIKKYRLKFAPTWDCWNLGSPPPRQPGLFSKLMYIQDSSAVAVLVVFIVIISVIAVIAIILSKSTKKTDLEELEQIEIE